MKRMSAIAASGAAILAAGAYLAGSGMLAQTSSGVAAVTGAPSSRAPSSPVDAPPASRAAAIETVTLSVKMWCASCPYIVKRSLEDVAGVLGVDVSYRDQTAVVRFDDTRTDVAALIEATGSLGFSSAPLVTD